MNTYKRTSSIIALSIYCFILFLALPQISSAQGSDEIMPVKDFEQGEYDSSSLEE